MLLINRELSWLSFNERVLQEAMDPENPLIERFRFLGIYSNNLDEFFRVRVAHLRKIIIIKKKNIEGFSGTPNELYLSIRETILKQQQKFEQCYNQLLEELSKNNIFQIDETGIDSTMLKELSCYFNVTLKHAIVPLILDRSSPFPRLKDSSIYLAIRIVSTGKIKFALIKIPGEFNRFYRIKKGDSEFVILLDDIIRLHLKNIFSIFSFEKIEAFTFKFTRDAELNLDDDISISMFEKIEKSLKQRKKGKPVRFVYDEKMPKDLLDYLLRSLNLKLGVNTQAGGKYHNFKDFICFPSFERDDFLFSKQYPVEHPDFKDQKSLLKSIINKDILLHFPYQQFDYVVDVLREAAIDPKVTTIKINVYRVANHSQVMNALMAAVLNGKIVTVVLELQARFDEENNLFWAEKLKENGAIVIYGIPNLKVHSKLMQITRINNKKEQFITYVGTGNFNEKTALVYSDLSLFTTDISISFEVKKVFNILENNMENSEFNHLMVSPFNSRKKIISLIENEIKNAKNNYPASIRIKLNNLTDIKIIEKLYEANQSGVKIELIIRGICCLVPGIKGKSENIKVISIVDRYLEHARFYIFHNNGKPLYYLSSADWMERNLDKRIEVACPIVNTEIQKELNIIFEYQWKGNVKSREINKDLTNSYRRSNDSPFQAQLELYKYYQNKIQY